MLPCRDALVAGCGREGLSSPATHPPRPPGGVRHGVVASFAHRHLPRARDRGRRLRAVRQRAALHAPGHRRGHLGRHQRRPDGGQGGRRPLYGQRRGRARVPLRAEVRRRRLQGRGGLPRQSPVHPHRRVRGGALLRGEGDLRGGRGGRPGRGLLHRRGLPAGARVRLDRLLRVLRRRRCGRSRGRLRRDRRLPRGARVHRRRDLRRRQRCLWPQALGWRLLCPGRRRRRAAGLLRGPAGRRDPRGVLSAAVPERHPHEGRSHRPGRLPDAGAGARRLRSGRPHHRRHRAGGGGLLDRAGGDLPLLDPVRARQRLGPGHRRPAPGRADPRLPRHHAGQPGLQHAPRVRLRAHRRRIPLPLPAVALGQAVLGLAAASRDDLRRHSRARREDPRRGRAHGGRGHGRAARRRSARRRDPRRRLGRLRAAPRLPRRSGGRGRRRSRHRRRRVHDPGRRRRAAEAP